LALLASNGNLENMSSMRPARLIVAIFAAIAMSVFVSARAAYSQDADDAAAGADANWNSTDAAIDPTTAPPIDEDAAAAEKVLEIPQVACAKDDASESCASGSDEDGDDSQAINAPSPGAPPASDDDTASNAVPGNDWGTADDYQNQQYDGTYGVPYAGYPYTVTGAPYPVTIIGTNRGPLPASAYVPSSPLTQAATPPLNPGPWVVPSAMSAFRRPAGSPMMGMSMHSSFRFHR
jgi:hypothetical protein